VLGESCNTGWTYGYDVVTMMQETKASLCRLARYHGGLGGNRASSQKET
jgi:hypothetical protein